jgi:hypothetical protein
VSALWAALIEQIIMVTNTGITVPVFWKNPLHNCGSQCFGLNPTPETLFTKPVSFLIFFPEDWASGFLQNVGAFLPNAWYHIWEDLNFHSHAYHHYYMLTLTTVAAAFYVVVHLHPFQSQR